MLWVYLLPPFPNFEQIANILNLLDGARLHIAVASTDIKLWFELSRLHLQSNVEVSNTHLACPVVPWAVELVCNQLIASPTFLLIAKQQVPVQMYPAYQQAV